MTPLLLSLAHAQALDPAYVEQAVAQPAAQLQAAQPEPTAVAQPVQATQSSLTAAAAVPQPNFTVEELWQNTPSAAPANGLTAGLGSTLPTLMIGLVGLGVALVGRKKIFEAFQARASAPTPARSETMKILERTALTPQTTLVLLEAPTGDGGHRRLLVGIGSGQAPVLVADLGGEVMDFLPPELTAPTPTPVEQEMARPQPVAPRLAPEPEVREEDWTPPSRFSGKFTDEDLASEPPEATAGASRRSALERMAQQSKLPQPTRASSPWRQAVDPASNERVRSRRDLVREVLSARGGR